MSDSLALSLAPFVLSTLFIIWTLGEEEFLKRKFLEYRSPSLPDEELDHLAARAAFVAKIGQLRFQPFVSFVTAAYAALGSYQRPILTGAMLLLSAVVAAYTFPFCERITLPDYTTKTYPGWYPRLTGRIWIRGLHLLVIFLALAVFLIAKLA